MEEVTGDTVDEMAYVVEYSDIYIQLIDGQSENQNTNCAIADSNKILGHVLSTEAMRDSGVNYIAHHEGSYDQSEAGSNIRGTVSTDSLTGDTTTHSRAAVFKAAPCTGHHNLQCKFCTAVVLFCVILLVIGVVQIPITLYYTDPPPAEGIEATLDLVDFQTCWVSD